MIKIIDIVYSNMCFWWWLFVILLKVKYSVVGIKKIVSICMKLVSVVGFLNGCDELVLKKLLLLVLSILIVFWEVIGFMGNSCCVFLMVFIVW